MIPESLTIGIIQFKPEPGRVEENLMATTQLLSSAAQMGSDLVVLPEMWPTGYGDFDAHKVSHPIPGLYTDFLSESARRHGIHIVAGIPEQGVGGKLHSTAVFLNDKGEIIAKHRKLHLYSLLGEEKTWTAGDGFTVVDTNFGRVGLLVCYDGDFPESWRANAVLGAQVIIQVNAYESPCENWWDKFYPSSALQNVVWGILCNAVGDTSVENRDVHFFGRSRIIAPDGEIAGEAPYIAPGEDAESFLLVKTVHLRNQFEEARRKFGNFLKDRRPKLYGVLGTNLSF